MGLAKSRVIPAALVSGLGTMAFQNAGSVIINSLTLLTPLSIAYGGTGANNETSARTNLGFADGESSPSLTNVANISASTISDIHYKKTGNDISGGMRITFDVVAASTYTELGINLPGYASNFNLFTQASGVVTTADQASLTYAIRADITNDRLALRGISGAGISNYEFYVEFSYVMK